MLSFSIPNRKRAAPPPFLFCLSNSLIQQRMIFFAFINSHSHTLDDFFLFCFYFQNKKTLALIRSISFLLLCFFFFFCLFARSFPTGFSTLSLFNSSWKGSWKTCSSVVNCCCPHRRLTRPGLSSRSRASVSSVGTNSHQCRRVLVSS